MPTVVSFEKRLPPSVASRGTLAELMAKRKLAADAQATAAAPQQINDPMQGFAQLANVFAGGLQERRAGREEDAARNQLAQIKAQIGYGEATPEQLAQMDVIDPMTEEKYREEALKARADATARQQAIEDRKATETFTHGENVYKTEAEIAAANAAAKVAAGVATTADERALAKQHDQQKAEAEAAAAKVKADADAAAAKSAEPQSPSGKAYTDWKNGVYGDPSTPQSAAARDAQIAHDTAVSKNKGMTITYDENGKPVITMGGSDDGNLGPQGPKNLAMSLDDYRKASVAANDILPTVDSMQKAYSQVGYTGPGGETWGKLDDIAEGLGVPSWAQPSVGTSASRATIRSGGLEFVQKQVQAYKGAISDKETAMFLAAAPGMATTPEGAQRLLGITKATALRAIQRDAEAQKWYRQRGNLDGFEQDWQLKTEANPTLIQLKDGTVDLAANHPELVGQQPQQNQPQTGPTDDDLIRKYGG